MTVSPSRQLDLFEAARPSWGEKPARTLMEYLIPDWDPDEVRRTVSDAEAS